MSNSSHSSRFYHPHNIGLGVIIIIIIIIIIIAFTKATLNKEIQLQILATRSLKDTNILRQAMSLLHAVCWFWFMSTQSAQLLRWVPLPPSAGIQ